MPHPAQRALSKVEHHRTGWLVFGPCLILCSSSPVYPPSSSSSARAAAATVARGVLLRVYGIVFSVFVIFAEMEWSKFTKFFGFLKYWPARGLFYIFVGLITWDQVCGLAGVLWNGICSFCRCFDPTIKSIHSSGWWWRPQ